MDQVVRCRVWRDGKVIEQGVDIDDLEQRIHDPGCLIWVDLVDPDAARLEEFGRRIGLTETSIEDALAPHERPKVTRHQEFIFFMTYAAELGPPGDAGSTGGRLRLERVAGFVSSTALLTVRSAGFDMDGVVSRWDENPDLVRAGGVGALVHGLLDVVVDGHFDTIQQFDDALEGIEDVLFDETGRTSEVVRAVYGIRKDLVALRRVVLPMREVVNELRRHEGSARGELDRWFDDLLDHVLRAAEWTESLRDMVTTVFETNLSLQDARLNNVMKKLASWAAIIAVPTAITGWFGQNVPYPGFSEPLGLWLSAALIAGLSVGLYAAFRKWDWL